MMDFLRRLNPTNAALASAARPVLAPRFSSARGIGTIETPRRAEAPTPVSSAGAPEARDPGAPTSWPAAHEPELPRPVAPGAPHAAPGREAEASVHVLLQASQPAGAAPQRLTEAHATPVAARHEAITEPAHLTALSPPTRAAEPEARPAARRPEPPATVHADLRLPPAPLSDQALASRMLPPPPSRPVIQVHIDRIDVRAPAAPVRPAAVRRSAPEPSVSLADYLRPGHARSGGAS